MPPPIDAGVSCPGPSTWGHAPLVWASPAEAPARTRSRARIAAGTAAILAVFSRESKKTRNFDAHPPDHRRVAGVASPAWLPSDPVSAAHDAADCGADAARARRVPHRRDRRAARSRPAGRPRRDHRTDALGAACL